MSNLDGKTIVAIGDSLICGNRLGNDAVWVNKLGKKHGMTVYNHGVNGNTVAAQPREGKVPPMCVRYKNMEDGADYVVVLGGANDKRLDVPIGDNCLENRDIHTFVGALNVLVLGLSAKYPRARILFMTNYDRWPSKNKLGYSDIDYVEAMKTAVGRWGIPVFDNYHCSGISFRNPVQLEWMDEGLSLGAVPNHHFSDVAYDWLAQKYEAVLEAL